MKGMAAQEKGQENPPDSEQRSLSLKPRKVKAAVTVDSAKQAGSTVEVAQNHASGVYLRNSK